MIVGALTWMWMVSDQLHLVLDRSLLIVDGFGWLWMALGACSWVWVASGGFLVVLVATVKFVVLNLKEVDNCGKFL